MGELRQFGVSVLTMGTAVRTFCLEQGNMKEVMFLKNLKHAEYSWKEIFRKTLWEIKTVALTMCNETITLPDDCEKLINISVVDRFGRQHPLTQDTDLNTAKIRCTHGPCSCSKCKGEDTLCGVLDSMAVATETIIIQGQSYTKTTYTRIGANGDILEVIDMPTLNATTDAVSIIRSQKTVCTVDVDDKGCIKASAPNMSILTGAFGLVDGLFGIGIGPFGWNGYNATYRELIPAVYNYWGYYNRNAQNPQIIHIFRAGPKSVPFSNDQNNNTSEEILESNVAANTGTILVSYQTNGETPGEEIIIPEYCIDALFAGIMYRQAKLNPKDRDKDGSMYNLFRKERTNLFKYLNPVNLEVVAKLATQARPW